MTLKEVGTEVRELMQDDEEWKGAFLATRYASNWWFFLIGPWAFFMTQQYLITVTDKRLYFTRLGVFKNPVRTDEFYFEEIRDTVIKNWLWLPYLKRITFIRDGRKIKLDVPFRKRTRENILGPEILEFLKEKLT